MGGRLRNSLRGGGGLRTRSWVAMSWGQLSPTNSWQKDGLWLNTLVSMKQNVSLHPKKNSSSERLPGTPESFWTGEHLGFTSASRLEPWPGFPTHGNEQKHMHPCSSKGITVPASQKSGRLSLGQISSTPGSIHWNQQEQSGEVTPKQSLFDVSFGCGWARQ